MTNDFDWLKSRSHEAYAKNYSIVFPHDEPLASRNVLKGALHEVIMIFAVINQLDKKTIRKIVFFLIAEFLLYFLLLFYSIHFV